MSSARAIPAADELRLPLLMNLLKTMHANGILCSERGSKGGYQICTNLDDLSLYDLIDAIEDADDKDASLARKLSSRAPLRALQYKLMHFLKQVRLSDLVVPGRRIDVPLDGIKAKKCNCQEHQDQILRNEAKLAVTI